MSERSLKFPNETWMMLAFLRCGPYSSWLDYAAAADRGARTPTSSDSMLHNMCPWLLASVDNVDHKGPTIINTSQRTRGNCASYDLQTESMQS